MPLHQGMIRSRQWLEFALAFALTVAPFAVSLRYKWGEYILPAAMVPLVCLLIVSVRTRASASHTLTQFLNGPAAFFAVASLLWISISMFWGVDFRLAGMGAAKAIGSICAALAVAAVVTTIPRDRIFPLLTFFIVAAGFVVVFTSYTQGTVHAVFNCCEGGMQPHLSGGAVTVALFLWACTGWLHHKGRRVSFLLLIALSCVVVAVSKSGAATLALLAGGLTVGIGLHAPQLALLVPCSLMFAGFLVAPFLYQFTSVLEGLFRTAGVQMASWSERVEIWTYYIDLFWRRPWTGYGLRAEEIVGKVENAAAYTTLVPTSYASYHAHNLPLQILFEFGIVGGVLVIAFAAVATWRLYNSGVGTVSPFGIAPAAAAAAAAALVNFGVWEWWWLAMVLLAFIFGGRVPARRNDLATAQPGPDLLRRFDSGLKGIVPRVAAR